MSHHCTQCDKTYERRSNYTVHMKRNHSKHSEGTQIRFHIPSDKAIKRKQNMSSDKQQGDKRSAVDPLMCRVCRKTFKSRQNLTDHVTIHTGDRPYKCEICDISFRLNSYLKRHKFLHHSGITQSKCRICGMSTLDLSKHMAQRHSGKRPYPCELCKKSFKKSFDVIRHQRMVHNFTPNISGKSYPYKQHPGKHTKLMNSMVAATDHVTNQSHTSYNKPQGRKFFLRRNRLTKNSCTQEKGYTCPTCGKSFKWKNSFKRHMDYHERKSTGLLGRRGRPKTRVPGKADGNTSLMEAHNTEHHVTANHVNGVQDRDMDEEYVAQPRIVKRQVTVPARRRHRCDICDEALADKNILARHLQIHVWETALQA